jgi:hypothetical protein
LALMLYPAAARGGVTGPDTFGYVATDSVSYSFTDIASTGTAVLAGSDDDRVAINIGFPFSFYGRTFTSACLSANGAIWFGACGSTVDFANQDLTAAPSPADLPGIAPFWFDLSFAARGAGSVHYQTLGTPGSRQFVAQWSNAFPVNAPKGVTFQAVLFEAGGRILFQYKDVGVVAGSPVANGGAATVGIRDTGGHTTGRRVQWSYKVPVLRNNQAIAFAPDSTPPIVTASLAGTAGSGGWYRSPVAVTWTVSDPETGVTNSTGCAPATLSTETAGTALTCTATNGVGMSASSSVTVKIDRTLPVIQGMPAAGCSLWPANKKLVTVATVTASDARSGIATGSFQVTATSNQPQDPKSPDIVITKQPSGSFVVQLKADNEGKKDDRIYTISATAADVAGNVTKTAATCVVPHDQGK